LAEERGKRHQAGGAGTGAWRRSPARSKPAEQRRGRGGLRTGSGRCSLPNKLRSAPIVERARRYRREAGDLLRNSPGGATRQASYQRTTG
jgi:hypothetical protein